MNGAIADPSVKTIRTPNSTRRIMIGASHHFFLSLINSQNSDNIDSLLIFSLSQKRGANPAGILSNSLLPEMHYIMKHKKIQSLNYNNYIKHLDQIQTTRIHTDYSRKRLISLKLLFIISLVEFPDTSIIPVRILGIIPF